MGTLQAANIVILAPTRQQPKVRSHTTQSCKRIETISLQYPLTRTIVLFYTVLILGSTGVRR